jgi:hypothetical protein
VDHVDGGSTDGGDLSPSQEVDLLESLLRHQVGIDPFRVGQVLDLAAVGIVNSAWRNSPVEDWHAGSVSLSDGAMLRINAHTTWRVREIVRRWRSDLGVAPGDSVAVLDDLDVDDVELLAERIFRWLVKPSRRLPIGRTLAQVASTGLEEYVDHADSTMGSIAATAADRGAPVCAVAGGCARRPGSSELVGDSRLAAIGRDLHDCDRRPRARVLARRGSWLASARGTSGGE